MNKKEHWFRFSWLGGATPIHWKGLLFLPLSIGFALSLGFVSAWLMQNGYELPGKIGAGLFAVTIIASLIFIQSKTEPMYLQNHDNEQWFETSDKTYTSRGSLTRPIHWKGLVFLLLNGGWIAGSLYYTHKYFRTGQEAEATVFGFLAFLGALVFFLTIAARSRQKGKSEK